VQPDEEEIIFNIGDLVEWRSSIGWCAGWGVVSRVDYVWHTATVKPRTRVYVLDEGMHTKLGRPEDFSILSRA
jgi:hypothetical protein